MNLLPARLQLIHRPHLPCEQPYVWCDHTGQLLQLGKMKTEHLINIVRLIVNQWAIRYSLEPVPIPNPVAALNLKDYHLEDFAFHSRMFVVEILRRTEAEHEVLRACYRRVWARVVQKIEEILLLMPETKSIESFDDSYTDEERAIAGNCMFGFRETSSDRRQLPDSKIKGLIA